MKRVVTKNKKIVVISLLVFIINILSSYATKITANTPPPIDGVIGVGSLHFSSKEIVAMTKEVIVGDTYNAKKVENDVDNLKNTGFFKTVNARPVTYKDRHYIVYEVVDNPTVQDIVVTGNQLVDSKAIIDIFKHDSVFNTVTINQDIEKVKELYKKKGFIAVVDDWHLNDAGVLAIKIVEAKIEAIEIKGNTKTKDWVVEKLTRSVHKGDYFNIENLKHALTDLKDSGYFKDVKLDILPGGQENGVKVVFTVEEDKTGEWYFGGGHNSRDGVVGRAGIKEKNIGGEGKELEFNTMFGKENRKYYDLSYKDNFYKKTDTAVTTRIYNDEYKEKTSSSEYNEQRRGGSVKIEKPTKNIFQRLFTIFQVSKVKTTTISGDQVEGATTNTVTTGIDTDTRDSKIDPEKGVKIVKALEFSSKAFGSDSNFTKISFDARKYLKIATNSVLAMRFVTRMSPEKLPTVEEFTLGGSESIRGIDEDSLRGNKMAMANVELRKKIADNVELAAFVDAGSAWTEAKDNKIHVSTGIGARLQTALGMLRFDIAKESGGVSHFVFGFGHAF